MAKDVTMPHNTAYMQRTRILLIALIVFPTLLSAQYENTPKVGEKAPALTVQQWVKGDPVLEFVKGQVYVVEFSATWCAPCRKAIPHLTELAKKYSGKIKIVSIYLEDTNTENPTDLSFVTKVKYFVETLGDKIGFPIAVDVPQKTTRITWGAASLPTAFVVDENGKICWSGYPMDLDPVLHQIINRTFDPVAAIERQTNFKNKLNDAKKRKENGDYRSALNIIDSLLMEYPKNTWLYAEKFRVLAGDADQEAYELLQWMLDNRIKNFDWSIFTGAWFHKVSPEHRNYPMELEALDRAIEEAETPYIKTYQMYIKADTYASIGDYENAIAWCERAIKNNNAPWETSTDNLKYEEKLYKRSLVLYNYRMRLADNSMPSNAAIFMRSVVDDGKIEVDSWLITAVMEVHPDYTLAMELVNLAIDREKSIAGRASLLGVKSRIYAAMQDFPKAIEYCQLAINEYNKKGGSANQIKRHERMLTEYKQKLGGG